MSEIHPPSRQRLAERAHDLEADHVIRLTETEVDALATYDDVVAVTRAGERVLVQMLPDEPCRESCDYREEDSDGDG